MGFRCNYCRYFLCNLEAEKFFVRSGLVELSVVFCLGYRNAYSIICNVTQKLKKIMEVITQQFTPEDILNILVEQHRISSILDFEANPEAKLNFDSTVNDWRNAGNLLPWKPLSEFLNKCFGISVPENQWKETLTPSRKRTLREVCELIAENCQYDDIKPRKIFGNNCLSASVFLTLKKYLMRRNVDVSKIQPSTLIAPYLDKYYSEMLEQIGIISKGKRIFDEFDYKSIRKLKFWEVFNVLDYSRYVFQTGEIKTFRDLTNKIIETA